ncbi:MAG: hypothetical protein RIF33_25915 [Cyclobacteriaceae bacterium]
MALIENTSASVDYSCSNCKTAAKDRVSTPSSFLSAVLVILIPKCHLCVMAYTSAITICGGPSMYMHSNNWMSYIPLALGLFIVGIILWNYKGVRSVVATGLAIGGFLLILFTHQLVIAPEFYHWGTGLMFTAIWLNSNMLSFVSFLRAIFKEQKIVQ